MTTTAMDKHESRVASFNSQETKWPPNMGNLTPERLSSAGFYFAPNELFKDRCVCFSCGKALHSWDVNDDPLYEHCRWSPNCNFLKQKASDNAALQNMSGADDMGPVDQRYAEDTVIDHLILCIHGIGATEERTKNYVTNIREKLDKLKRSYFPERSMVVAVEAIVWESATLECDETIAAITLSSVPKFRELANNTLSDVLFYMSPRYQQIILNTVAKTLNDKYQFYVRTYPKFSGRVSIFAHSLGSVIMFDLLQHQRPHDNQAPSMTLVSSEGSNNNSEDDEADDDNNNILEEDEDREDLNSSINSRKEEDKLLELAASMNGGDPFNPDFGDLDISRSSIPRSARSKRSGGRKGKKEEGSRLSESSEEESERRMKTVASMYDPIKAGHLEYPVLEFDVQNVFALGSPISMFVAVRGDTLPHPFKLPNTEHFFNIFHPNDPVAYRFEPLLDRRYSAMTAAIIPSRVEKKSGVKDASGPAANPALPPPATTTTTTTDVVAAAAAENSDDIASIASIDTTPANINNNNTNTNTNTNNNASVAGDASVDPNLIRYDYVLQPKELVSVNQYLSSLSSHWCYWDSKDTFVFMLDQIDQQQMTQDFFRTTKGRDWLSKCERLLEDLNDDKKSEELFKTSEEFLSTKGMDMVDKILQSENADHFIKLLKRNEKGQKLLADFASKDQRQQLIGEGLKYLSEMRKKEEGRRLMGEVVQDERSREIFITRVKEQVLSSLLQYLSTVEVPPIAGQRQTSAGQINYAIGGIILSNVTIPSQSFFVSFTGRRISVKASDISALLKNFTWIYKQKSFPYFKDNGTADADMRGVSVWLTFDLERVGRASKLTAANIIKMKHLDIKLQKSKANWIYNMLFSLFSERLRISVEEALTNVLNEKMSSLSSLLLPLVDEYLFENDKKDQNDVNNSSASAASARKDSTASDAPEETEQEKMYAF